MIFVLVGQSNTGKDSLMNVLLSDTSMNLERFLYCTTRPKRESEVDGREYWFKTESQYYEDIKSGGVVESRSYALRDKTVMYYTLDYIDQSKDYIVTGTINQCISYIDYYGVDIVKPIRVLVSDYDRLLRGISRERSNHEDYYEVCRRFMDEFEEYTEQNFSRINFLATVENNNFEKCCSLLKSIIRDVTQNRIRPICIFF